MATRKKLTASARIRAYIKTHPNAKPTEIVAATGVKLNDVHSTLWRDKNKTQAKRAEWSTFVPFTTDTPMHITMEEPKEEPQADMVNSPPHYKVGGIEVIDFIKAKLTLDEFRGYLQGNILRYSSRVGYKGNASEDVGKLIWYANKLQETFPA
jgi:hypothetical protein